MVDSDRVGEFFDELGRRGHEPLLDRMAAVGRVELYGGERIECWFVTVRNGDIAVSRDGGEAGADWVLKADRRAFERVIRDDAGLLAALIRGAVSVELVDPAQRLGLINRLFTGLAR